MTALVVGYGNRLRGDDGAGPSVAEALLETVPPDVHVLTVHQLTLEWRSESRKSVPSSLSMPAWQSRAKA